MDPKTFQKIESIFNAAAELKGQARANFLDQECGNDEKLRSKVESLLAIENSKGFIDASPQDLAASLLAERKETDLVGELIGEYRILSMIGKGGMGEIYLALDDSLKRKAAIKILLPEVIRNTDRVNRFIHEARTASALNHPNILTVYSIGESKINGEMIRYISMEYVEGKLLTTHIYDPLSDPNELLGYLCQVGTGLAKAHDAGIIHRDLKPENIMGNTDGFVKVLDFGLAKLVDKTAELNSFQKHKSRSGVILGTVGYMSPEQAKGDANIDQRADIFSFGCILYEAVSGRKPFTEESPIDSLHEIIHRDPVPVSKYVPSIPPELQKIIEKCLAKSPEQRFAAIGEVVELLKPISIPGSAVMPKTDLPPGSGTESLEDATPTITISQPAFDQRKQVTVVYGDISSIAELFNAYDPEEASGKLKGLWAKIDSIVADGGGEISTRSGDAFNAVWGLGVAQEADPERAIRTSLNIQREIMRYFRKNLSGEFDLADFAEDEEPRSGLLRIGINTGVSLVSFTDNEIQLDVSSSVSNVAKSLVNDTGFGDTYISHETYCHVRGVFEVEPKQIRQNLLLKKEVKEFRVYRVIRAKPRAFRLRTRGIEGVESRLIGRQGELDKMKDALYSVGEENELQAITIVGEAGLGKSRLLYEFRDELELLTEKFRVFNTRAIERTNNLPFSLLHDLFAFRFEIADSDPDEIAREKFSAGIRELLTGGDDQLTEEEIKMRTHFIGNLIGLDYSASTHLKGVSNDPGQTRDRALFYAKEFFRHVSSVLSTVIYLDDIHWADKDSLDFFEQMIAELSGSRIMIISLARPVLYEKRPHWGEGVDNHTRILLELLSKRETRQLVNNLLRRSGKPDRQLVDLIVANSNGNP
ncbi:MAG: protein kinase, partial [Acidobacteria bacterium]|nr:protein kinase [Acidobacteriota bacterium]